MIKTTIAKAFQKKGLHVLTSLGLCAHHGQVAEMLTDLAASLGGLKGQPFPSRLLASLHGAQAAVMGAVAGGGEQTRLVKFLSLAHLYVPVGQEGSSLSWDRETVTYV